MALPFILKYSFLLKNSGQIRSNFLKVCNYDISVIIKFLGALVSELIQARFS